jgi:hypothetical protein
MKSRCCAVWFYSGTIVGIKHQTIASQRRFCLIFFSRADFWPAFSAADFTSSR